MTVTRAMALIGIALPFALGVMSEMFDGILGTDPLIPLLASFVIAMGMYLPWISQTFKQDGMIGVCGIAVAALVIHFLIAYVIFVIMFWIGGDTI